MNPNKMIMIILPKPDPLGLAKLMKNGLLSLESGGENPHIIPATKHRQTIN